MAELVGNTPIKIVQGATKKVRRKFDEVKTALIDKVILTCNELNINAELDLLENGEFVYVFEAEETAEFEPMKTTYDVTVINLDGSVDIETHIPFIVFKRENPIPSEENEENNGGN